MHVVPGPNIIVAMGLVSDNGSSVSVYRGYNVSSCVWNPTLTCYEVTLTGIEYSPIDYVAHIEPWDLNHGAYTTNLSGMLLVAVLDSGGNAVRGTFSFTVVAFP